MSIRNLTMRGHMTASQPTEAPRSAWLPLAAWTIATISLAESWDSGLLSLVSWISMVVLSVLRVYVTTRTLLGLRSGSIWAH